jgi:hypothetical protein
LNLQPFEALRRRFRNVRFFNRTNNIEADMSASGTFRPFGDYPYSFITH